MVILKKAPGAFVPAVGIFPQMPSGILWRIILIRELAMAVELFGVVPLQEQHLNPEEVVALMACSLGTGLPMAGTTVAGRTRSCGLPRPTAVVRGHGTCTCPTRMSAGPRTIRRAASAFAASRTDSTICQFDYFPLLLVSRRRPVKKLRNFEC